MKSKIDWRIVITGIVCITLLMGWALFLGFDGVLLTGALSLIALAIGVAIPKDKFLKK